jgi:hypothetical protein
LRQRHFVFEAGIAEAVEVIEGVVARMVDAGVVVLAAEADVERELRTAGNVSVE